MTNNKIHHQIIVPEELNNKRLDYAASKLLPEYSRSLIQKWIKANMVKLDEHPAKPKDHVLTGQKIEVSAEAPDDGEWKAEDIDPHIMFEDESFYIINKPPGLVTHPAPSTPKHTLMNALLHYDSNLKTIPRAGMIHRLDKDTSGLLIVARTEDAQLALLQQMKARDIQRQYVAIVHGTMTSGGTIETEMGRHPKHRTKMAVVNEGRIAITHYKIRERLPFHTVLTVTLETGRTHQIRVHMAHLGHPVIGDKVYSKNPLPKGCPPEMIEALRKCPRHMLHAERLSFIHPKTGERVTFEAPIPEDMVNITSILRP